MDLALKSNLNNLNEYWQALDVSEQDGLFAHTSWPNKQWHADFSLPSYKASVSLPKDKTFSTITDINDQELSGFSVKSQLVIMNLSLANNQTALGQIHPQIVKLSSKENAATWATACGLAFGYVIDADVIQALLNNPEASVWAYMVDGEIAGTAISYSSDNTLGIHQLGTVPSFRKMGIADALMKHLLAQASSEGFNTVSLQASKAGLHLYEKMGFKALGNITSLVITK
ncbi:MAG: GNAT family N-acetyltransferase [Colwellia sp.]|nr:GNAT family N-acetyltransferase [Colwellia sp.]